MLRSQALTPIIWCRGLDGPFPVNSDLASYPPPNMFLSGSLVTSFVCVMLHSWRYRRQYHGSYTRVIYYRIAHWGAVGTLTGSEMLAAVVILTEVILTGGEVPSLAGLRGRLQGSLA